MKVRRTAKRAQPGYPSLRQFARGTQWLGVAAIGLGAVASLSGCVRRTGGVVALAPQPESPTTWTTTTGGVMAPEPACPVTETNLQAHAAYTVKKGDTLSSVAQRLLGKASRWREIAVANPGIVPERLKIGQTLVIPAAANRIE